MMPFAASPGFQRPSNGGNSMPTANANSVSTENSTKIQRPMAHAAAQTSDKGGNQAGNHFLAAREAAKLLGVSVQAVRKSCLIGRLDAVTVMGSGGQQYRINPLSLPEPARSTWLAQVAGSSVSDAPQAARIVTLAESETVKQASNHQRVIGDARALILNAVRNLRYVMGCSQRQAILALLAQLDAGQLTQQLVLAAALANDKNKFRFEIEMRDGLPVAAPIHGQDVGAFAGLLTQRTVERWFSAEATGQALIPRRSPSKGTAPAWVPYFLQFWERPQQPPVSVAYEEMCKILPPHIKVPSDKAVYWWKNHKYSKRDVHNGRLLGYEMNAVKRYNKRTTAGMMPMQEIHSDGWGTHFKAPHPVSNKFVNFECWHTHDVRTRRVFRPYVGIVENTYVIIGSLFNAVEDGGVPAIWQTDNTSSVKNDRVEFNPVTSLEARLSFTIVHNLPGNSRANGICENFNKYLDNCAKRDIATYTGKDMSPLATKKITRITRNMVKAQSAEERRLLKAQVEGIGKGMVFDSYKQVVDWFERVCAEFNDLPHRALPKIRLADGKSRHMTPNEMWAKHIAEGWEPMRLSDSELRLEFRPHETCRVRKGVVTIMQQRYAHPALDHLHGVDVQVAYEMSDGSAVWVKDMDGKLICKADFLSDSPYRRRNFDEISLEKRADGQIKRKQRDIAEIEAQIGRGVVDMEPRGRMLSDTMVVDGGALIRPARTAEVVEAKRQDDRPSPTPADRYAKWQAIDARIAQGEEVTEKERLLHEMYPTSAEYRAMKRSHGDNVAPLLRRANGV